MFGSHKSLNVKLVNDKKSETAAPAEPNAILAKITSIKTKDVVKVTAGAVVTYAFVVAINTASDIATNRFSN